MKLKKEVDYVIKDLGLYKLIELKSLPDRFYYICETDKNMKTFNVIVVLKRDTSHFSFRLLNANIGMPDEIMEEDEKYVFPNGRSRSKYLNAIIFFNYLELKNVDYNSELCNSIGALYYSLSQITKISPQKLSEGQYNFASYFNDLFESQLMGGNVFIDSEFEKGEMNSRKSLRFFLNSLYIYNKEVNEVKRIEWKYEGKNILLNLIYKNGDKFRLTGLKFDIKNPNKEDVLNIKSILFYSNFNKSNYDIIFNKRIGYMEK